MAPAGTKPSLWFDGNSGWSGDEPGGPEAWTQCSGNNNNPGLFGGAETRNQTWLLMPSLFGPQRNAQGEEGDFTLAPRHL
ncbi:hypothetical protein PBY51_022173 [Eleginops maclovinus]|uniref:Uncharacterized protein n=1 Tax=Eleginops maclovinus TaxID=56733 RepID=A0AAN8AMS1_ELEMC|nr:hypothetical protein PBY51_022173 [Eleginops maclovinus]